MIINETPKKPQQQHHEKCVVLRMYELCFCKKMYCALWWVINMIKSERERKKLLNSTIDGIKRFDIVLQIGIVKDIFDTVKRWCFQCIFNDATSGLIVNILFGPCHQYTWCCLQCCIVNWIGISGNEERERENGAQLFQLKWMNDLKKIHYSTHTHNVYDERKWTCQSNAFKHKISFIVYTLHSVGIEKKNRTFHENESWTNVRTKLCTFLTQHH